MTPRVRSLKANIIISFSLILIVGGLATSFIGSWMVSATIMRQARNKVRDDLSAARMVYQTRLKEISEAIYLVATGNAIKQVDEEHSALLRHYLEGIRRRYRMDFLTLTDANGRVVLRTRDGIGSGDDVSHIKVIQAALNGAWTTSTTILSGDDLAKEHLRLAEQARLEIIPTPHARPINQKISTDGLVLMAAVPVYLDSVNLLGVLYGGTLLNRNYWIVDQVKELVYKGERYGGAEMGTATIFMGDLRVSTNVMTNAGDRAIGTCVSDEVKQAVLQEGKTWIDRAFVVEDWYISAYEPLKDFWGRNVGILYVGLLEKRFLEARNGVILAFFGIASVGFILIVVVAYLITRSMTSPLEEMVKATEEIAAGNFHRVVPLGTMNEIGKLALSFNTMQASLRRMQGELQEWGRTLEQKVKERTEELVAMQHKMAQSERMASLGKLAAGVAHEINNPLGGILAFSSLALEDLPEGEESKDLREYLDEIVRQAARCRDIVKGLLDFSRQSEGRTAMISLNDVLARTLSLLEKQAIFHDIELVRNLDSSLPLVMADDSQMQQMFMNIILNAVDAMDEKGRLTFRTWKGVENGRERAMVSIADTGCGIPEDIINHIFDPFFTTKEVGQGTGLGLAIAYGIVTQHNGLMTVDSTVGKGTTFIVSLPLPTEGEERTAEQADRLEA